MEKEHCNGKMEGSMLGSISRIKKQDLGFLLGLMEENILAIGWMENRMDLVSMHPLMEKLKLGNGLKVRGSIGLLRKKFNKKIFLFQKKKIFILNDWLSILFFIWF